MNQWDSQINIYAANDRKICAQPGKHGRPECNINEAVLEGWGEINMFRRALLTCQNK